MHAYDAPLTLLGQGTVGLELEEQASELDTLLVAVGGGGLIGGIAAWYQGRVRIVGVEPETAPTLHAALEGGQHRSMCRSSGLAADSLGAEPHRRYRLRASRESMSLDRCSCRTTPFAGAQLVLWERLRIVAEPGGAARSRRC